MNFVEQIASQYQAKLGSAAGREKQLRETAWRAYQSLGLPHRKSESWKYSSVQTLTNAEWRAAATEADIPAEVHTLLESVRGQFDCAVMLNGQLRLEHSRIDRKSGYKLVPVKDYDFETPDFNDGLVGAVLASHAGGYALTVEAGVQVARPLLIVHVVTGEHSWCSSYNQIHLGKNSELLLSEIFMGASALRTDVTYAKLEEHAKIHWLRSQEEHASATHFSDAQLHLEQAATARVHQLNCGAQWARGNLKVTIHGERAQAQIHGLTFGRGTQHLDQRVEVTHLAGHSESSQLFKGILRDRSRGVLNGKIYIAKNAQKVLSSQLNHNLLVGEGAEADTKPELEIYADDVKANHGASIGKLDDDKLFYLMSRAIPRAEAEQMLAQAFVGDVIMKIEQPALRLLTQQRVSAHLEIL